MSFLFFALLIAFSSPLVLLFLEKTLPNFYLGLEEGVKLLVVWLIIKEEKRVGKSFFWYGVLGGFLFALSEANFYLINILNLGRLSLFFQRLILTGILHTTTISLLYWFSKKGRWGMFLGLGITIFLHYSYNQWAGVFRGL